MGTFAQDYANLERDFQRMAVADGNVFIPMIRPAGKVDFVLIGSEPSFDRWAESPDDARRKVAQRYRNSATTLEDFVFHYSVKRFLCADGQRYYVTDLSKGAMLVDEAKWQRLQRYDRWLNLLHQELELVSHMGTQIFSVGDEVAKYLKKRKRAYAARFPHFSGNAVGHWKKIKEAHTDEYASFEPTIRLQDVLDAAREVLMGAGMHQFVEEILARMRVLPDSRKWLAFSYKVAVADWRASQAEVFSVESEERPMRFEAM